jgi:4-hydroxy-2-oxoheptanedioate aldolase
MLFIGPNDLALSLLGYTPAQQTEPKFVHALQAVVDAAKKHGKKTGILVSTGKEAREAAKRFDFVAIGGDVKAITWWYGQQLDDARGQ